MLLRLLRDGVLRLVTPRDTCPVCGYHGPFSAVHPLTGIRPRARCGGCGALERHRLQFLVIEEALRERDPSRMNVLHAAPERFFSDRFRSRFAHYVTTDLCGPPADLRVDLTRIPFEDGLFDMVFASHVLEHVPGDERAIREVARVLKPGGLAILPVPVIGAHTVEYPAPNPSEEDHVRCPGRDYFRRFEPVFARVRVYGSGDFPERFQLYCYEDRARWPASMPLRPRVLGRRHEEFVPVCVKGE